MAPIPIDFWGQGVKDQGHINLVGKNGFRQLTQELKLPWFIFFLLD
jgi:hypothetical protein